MTIFDVNGNTIKEFPLGFEARSASKPLWSHDYKKVIVTSFTGKRMAILSVDIGNVQYFDYTEAGWSPNGEWLVTWTFIGGTEANINVVNLNSGQYYRLAVGKAAAWQPLSDMTNLSSLAQPVPISTATSSIAPVPTGVLCADVTITVRDTDQGNYLQICAGDFEYEVGPLETGAFAIGPNKVFYVYATRSGLVYAARIGDERLTLIGDVKRFRSVVLGETPIYKFVFHGDHPYSVQIFDEWFKDNETIQIPRYITTPN